MSTRVALCALVAGCACAVTARADQPASPVRCVAFSRSPMFDRVPLPPPPAGYDTNPRAVSPADPALDPAPEPPAPLDVSGDMQFLVCEDGGCGVGGCESVVCDPAWRLIPDCGLGLSIYGWVAGGATANGRRPASRFNGPIGFNDRNEGQLNQLYGVIERPLMCDLDVGGRIDVLYGTDYLFVEAAGLERRPDGQRHWNGDGYYGVALPQFYFEVGSPCLSARFGHFYSLFGYESAMAANNFFYSHSYARLYGQPFTLTGVLAKAEVLPDLHLYGGVVNGWDKLDAVTDPLSYLAGACYVPCDDSFSVSVMLLTGREDGTAPPVSQRTVTSMTVRANLMCNLTYVYEHTYGTQQAPQVQEWYGAANYLFYELNECWAFGVRGEWFRDHRGGRVTGVRATQPIAGQPFTGNFWEISTGINWTPHPNVRFRPELRWDWFDGPQRPFADGTKNSQFVAAMDVIVEF